MSQKLVRLLGGVMAVFCLVSNRVHAATMTTTTPTTTPTTPETTTPTTPETSTPTTPETTTPTTPGTSTPTTPSGGTSFTCPAKTAPWPLPIVMAGTTAAIPDATPVGRGIYKGYVYDIYKTELPNTRVSICSGKVSADVCRNPAQYMGYCDSNNVLYVSTARVGWSWPSGGGCGTGIDTTDFSLTYYLLTCDIGFYRTQYNFGAWASSTKDMDNWDRCRPCYGIDYQTGHAECGFYAASTSAWNYSYPVTPNGNGFQWYSDQSQTGMASCRAMPIDDVVTVDGSDNTGAFEIIVDGECVYSD